jgi:shikimate dehydrogenase
MTHPDRFLLAGLMGFPVMHSRSPKLHNYWLAQHGLVGSYLPLPSRQTACARRCGRSRCSASPAAT